MHAILCTVTWHISSKRCYLALLENPLFFPCFLLILAFTEADLNNLTLILNPLRCTSPSDQNSTRTPAVASTSSSRGGSVHSPQKTMRPPPPPNQETETKSNRQKSDLRRPEKPASSSSVSKCRERSCLHGEWHKQIHSRGRASSKCIVRFSPWRRLYFVHDVNVGRVAALVEPWRLQDGLLPAVASSSSSTS